jgi:hypothetical protein
VIKKELWKDVPEWEDVYEISNLGRVRRKSTGFIRKPVLGHRGYYHVSLCCKGRKKTIDIHVILAKAFIANPLNLPEVNHVDGNKANYLISNLEWVTTGGNQKHAYDTGLKQRPLGERNVKAKITSELALEIFNTKMSRRAIARKYGINKTLVENIKSGRTWSHVTGKQFESVADKMARYSHLDKAPAMWWKNKNTRERFTEQILNLHREGLTGRQIGYVLGIAHKTVSMKIREKTKEVYHG